MTDPTTPRRSHKRQPQPRVPTVRPARDTLIIDHESFQAMCRSLLNFSEELANISRDIAEIKLLNFQIGANQESLSGDIAAIMSGIARLEQLAQLPPPAPQYRPQYDHTGQPVRQIQQAPPQARPQPIPLREMLRQMPGVPQPQQPQQQQQPQDFIPQSDNGERRR